MRVLRAPHSTNVERVALALAHKGMAIWWVDVKDGDRSAVRELSGQDLVPVLETDHGEVIVDSMRIVAWLEAKRPAPPLWPAHPGRRAEVDVFIEWFNLVWKRPPNLIAAELQKPEPDEHAIHDWSARMRDWLEWFEALLDGRDWLLTESFGAADLCAFPFLKYGAIEPRPGDGDPFHRVLHEHLPLAGFANLEAWVARVDALPRA